jgi:hypothetical protein
LASAYQEQERIHLAPAFLAQQTVDQVQHYRYYHAWHQNRGMYELVQRKDLACLTLLRDPVERTVSSIYFLQRTLTEQPHQLPFKLLTQFFPLRHVTISECLNHDSFRPLADNLQTQQLGLKSDYSSFFGSGEVQALTQLSAVPYPSLTEVLVTKQVFTDACAWLAEMTLVGIMERYAEMVILTCDLLGIAPPQQTPQANVNPQRTNFTMRYRQQLDPAVVAQVEEMNRYDTELYTFACELFEQQWSRYQARPRRTYSLAPRLRQTSARARRMLRPIKRFVKQSLAGKTDEGGD